jgi:hypothetical protein
VLAWDIFNEPEWGIVGSSGLNPTINNLNLNPVSLQGIQAFVGKCAIGECSNPFLLKCQVMLFIYQPSPPHVCSRLSLVDHPIARQMRQGWPAIGRTYLPAISSACFLRSEHKSARVQAAVPA